MVVVYWPIVEPFRPMLTRDSMFPRWMSEVTRSGWSWGNEVVEQKNERVCIWQMNIRWPPSCLVLLTGCLFLFSLWFWSMFFKSRSPSSCFSVDNKETLYKYVFEKERHTVTFWLQLEGHSSLTGGLHVLGGEAGQDAEWDGGGGRGGGLRCWRPWLWKQAE